MSSLDKEKTAPVENKKKTGTENIKEITKQNISEFSEDEHLQNMKDMYGETEDSFIKWMRGNEEYAKKCQKMSDKEVLEFAKTDLGLREYHSKIIDKKINKPKEENKPEVKPADKPAEPKKEPDKKPDDKPKEKKKHFRSGRFTKKEKTEKKSEDKKEKKAGFISRVGSWIWNGIKAIPHQTWNLVSYAPRVARSSLKYVGFDWINHGLNKPGLKKNRDNYASKWKWEQTAKKK